MSLNHRLIASLCCAVLATGAAGCGSDEEESPGPQGSDTEVTTPNGAPMPPQGGGANPELRTQVRVVSDGEPGEFGRSTAAESGDLVQVAVEVVNLEQAQGGRLRITIPRGPGESLDVTSRPLEGTAGGSQAEVTSAGDGDVQLGELRWGCLAPPEGFCPVDAERSDSRYVLELDVPQRPTRIVLTLMASS
jgi:hypothetical protein